jgi:heterodisulfide reductase subunit B
MKFALQRCCTTPIFLQQYESSTDAILKTFGIQLLDEELGCCGYPLKNFSFRGHALCSARNLALAERGQADILTFCNCCYGTLKQVNQVLKEDPSFLKGLNQKLRQETLAYTGSVEIKHLMEVFYHDIGLDRLRDGVAKTFKGLKLAIHCGCHILRPRALVRFDGPGTNAVFHKLVELTGAEAVTWKKQPECCGSPMWGIDNELSMNLTEKKILDARRSGAAYLCLACSYCQVQFDRVQKALISKRPHIEPMPSILYTQLLGLSLGIDERVLGISKNQLDISGILKFLNPS